LIFLTTADFTISKPESDLCELVVIALEGHCRLDLTFQQFALADSPGCANEHLEIEGWRYCGCHPAGQTGRGNEQ
jgi:hypothetical protein